MKILHTSDWHLGRTFHGTSLHDVSERFIDELIATVAEENIDAVLISGDVYDNATPSTETIQLLNRALTGLVAVGAQVIFSSGNHDSPRRLGFGAELFATAGVHIMTRCEQAWQHPVILSKDGVRVGVYAIPYLNPRYHGPVLGAEPTHAGVLGAVTERIRENIAELRKEGGLDYSIALAHAFITRAPAAREQEDTGGEQTALTEPARSDSERDISIGGVEAAPASLFDGIDYTALGHLHGRQRVSDTIRYSGSPLAFSFSEENHVKGAWLLTLTRDAGGVSASIDPINWDTTLHLKTLRGTLTELLNNPAFEPYEDAFCRIYLEQENRPLNPVEQLRKRFPHIASFEFRSTVEQVQRSPYHRTRENITPQVMCREFYAYVRGAPLSEREEEILTAIIEEATEPGGDAADSKASACSSTD